MANQGSNGGFPTPRGVPSPKGVATPKQSPFRLGQAFKPVPKAFGGASTPKPKPTVAKPVGSRSTAGQVFAYQAPATKQVKVKAHTRTVAVKAPPPAAAPPQQQVLPPTADKPVARHAAPPKAATPAPPQGQTPDYSNLLLYPNQTPEQLAQAALAPQYTQLDNQTAAEQAAVQSFTQAILQQLQGQPAVVGQAYTDAANQISGFANQGANLLGSLNPNAQDQALLKSIGAPQSQQDQVAGQLQNEFGSGGAALYGMRGLVPARSLAEQGAAAQAYAASLPGIEALSGQQAMKNLLYQAATQRQQIGAQLPTLENQYATSQSDAAQKVAALQQNAQALGIKTQQQNFTNQVTLKKLSQTDTGLQIQQERVAYQKAAKAAGAKVAAGKIDPSVSKVVGYVATGNGTPVTKNGKIIPVAASGLAGAPKVPTADEVSKLVDGWKSGKVQSVRVQATDKNGDPAFNPTTNAPIYVSESVQVGKVGYGQAYRRLRAMGITDTVARQYLNTAYQRGQQGRAWITNTEQQTLIKAGLPPKARVINGKGVLTPKQTAVLRKAGSLPKGQLTREGFYVIASSF